MKTILTSILFLIAGFLSAQTYTIEVQVRNVRSDKGIVSAALYDNADNFPSKDSVYMTTESKAVKGETVIRFENVPAGRYAIAILHDENENGDMDTNFLGFAQEGYCFSNNVRAKLSAPKFEKTSFRLKGDLYTTLFLRY
jgi:uncharacterized protein (DUF2141 family)